MSYGQANVLARIHGCASHLASWADLNTRRVPTRFMASCKILNVRSEIFRLRGSMGSVCICVFVSIAISIMSSMSASYRLEYLSKSSGKLPARRKVAIAYSEPLMVGKGFGSATLPPARRDGSTIRSLWSMETRHQDRVVSAMIASRPTSLSSSMRILARKTCSAAPQL